MTKPDERFAKELAQKGITFRQLGKMARQLHVPIGAAIDGKVVKMTRPRHQRWRSFANSFPTQGQ